MTFEDTSQCFDKVFMEGHYVYLGLLAGDRADMSNEALFTVMFRYGFPDLGVTETIERLANVTNSIHTKKGSR